MGSRCRVREKVWSKSILIVTDKKQLRQVSKPWNGTIDELKDLCGLMYDAMQEEKGVGIAAVQVGVPVRIFLAGDTEDPQLFVNPRNVKLHPSTKKEWEGCLSCPNTMVRTTRSRQIELTYDTLVEGEWYEVTRKFKGFEAVKVQHELDHLNGWLIEDRGKKFTP
jgi:peptide deformylase|tara:strand:- start:131 stop:625 length:495 start_codon:yes stop_codon:yes gene_type:complete